MIKFLLKLTVMVTILIFGWVIYLRVFEPEKYAKWEADEARKSAELQARRDEDDAAEKKKDEEELASRLAKQAAEKAKLESPSYKRGARDGWSIGFATGKDDANNGRPRRGLWAKKTAAQFVSGKKNEVYSEAYIKNAHEGYNEGWHRQMNLLREQGLID